MTILDLDEAQGLTADELIGEAERELEAAMDAAREGE